MDIKTIPTFTQLSLTNKVNQTDREKQQSLEIASSLDKITNKYQNDQWKYSPAISFYRNTFVEAQNENFKKRLNMI